MSWLVVFISLFLPLVLLLILLAVDLQREARSRLSPAQAPDARRKRGK